MHKKKLIEAVLKLHELGGIKFGEFVLKSQITAPFYIDLRLIVSCPSLLKTVGELMWEQVQDLTFDHLVGVPYTALPIATQMSLSQNIPMLMRRKEAKAYGTKKIIEGLFQPKDRCLIVEDLVTSGASMLETIAPLKELQLDVQDLVVFLDREQGGTKRLQEQGYRLHRAITITQLVEILCSENKISEQTKESVLNFVKNNQV